MAHRIQLISTDFDGTLHSEWETPPVPVPLQESIAALQTNGAKWVINTGRDYTSLMQSLDAAKLSIRPDFLVVVEREIHIHDSQQFVGLHEWNEVCMREHEEIFARVRQDMPQLVRWIKERFEATVYEDAYSPFCLIAQNNQEADQILDFVGEYCSQVPKLTIVRNDIYARFSHESYHKGSALQEIARRLNIPTQGILAAGDHWNDLTMLSNEYAACLVAPDNAIPTVKESVLRQGGYVSTEPFGWGVARGIQHYLGSDPHFSEKVIRPSQEN